MLFCFTPLLLMPLRSFADIFLMPIHYAMIIFRF